MKIAISAIALIAALFVSAGHVSAATHYRYEDVVRNTSGRVVSGATCTVRAVSDSSLAHLYTGPTLLAQAINPATTDIYGRFGFYIDPGRYFIEIKRTGIVDYTQFGVDIVAVPTNGAPVIYGGPPNPSTTNFPGLLLYNSFGQSFAFWDGSDWISIRDASDLSQIVAWPTQPDTVGQRGLLWYDQTNDDMFLYDGTGWSSVTIDTSGTGGTPAAADSTTIRFGVSDMFDDNLTASSVLIHDLTPPFMTQKRVYGVYMSPDGSTDGAGEVVFQFRVPDNYTAGTDFTLSLLLTASSLMVADTAFELDARLDVMRPYKEMPVTGAQLRDISCVNNAAMRARLPGSALTGTTINELVSLWSPKATFETTGMSGINLAPGDMVGIEIRRVDVEAENLYVLEAAITMAVD
jgi:hypothetical protein